MQFKMHQYHLRRGTTFGECYCSPDRQQIYINIPKNASTWTNPHLRQQGWSLSNFHLQDLSQAKAIVALREPVERWFSGIAEYFWLYHRNLDLSQVNQVFFDLVFDQIVFDDHTEKQVYFIDGFPLEQCVWFWVSPNYSAAIAQYLALPIKDVEHAYVTKGNEFKTNLQQLLKTQYQSNQTYQGQLKNYFRDDYKLINSVRTWQKWY